MSKERILVVEDDIWQSNFLRQTLAVEGFDVSVLPSGEEFFQTVEAHDFDAVVLDLGLPDEDGIVLARKLRARSKLPIVVVTAREELEDKLASFDVGADDYLTKPVEPKELAARLRAVIRRATEADDGQGSLHQLGEHKLDIERREVIATDGTVFDLTPAEFALTVALHHAQGKAVTRDEIVDAVSSGDGPLNFRAVDILVSRVRKKLGKGLIETVTGTGYRIVRAETEI